MAKTSSPRTAPTDPAAVLEEIRAGRPKPVYLIHGTEEFLVEACANRIVNALAGTGQEAAEVIRSTEDSVDWGALLARLRTPSLFEPKLVFLIPWAEILAAKKKSSTASRSKTPGTDPGQRQPEEKAEAAPADEDSEALREILENGFGTQHVLVLTAVEVDRRRVLYKTIRRVGQVLDFSPRPWEQQQAARRFIQDRLRGAGKTAVGDALQLLDLRVGFNLRRLAGEIDKLLLFIGEKKEITADDVDAVIGTSREEQIFDLTEKLGQGEFPEAAVSLRQLLQQGEPYMMILGFLRRQFERIVTARGILDGDLGGRWKPAMGYPEFQRTFLPELKSKQEAGEFPATEGHPYALYMSLKQAGPFKAAAGEQILREMHRVHRGIVSGAGHPPLLLEDLLHRVCRIQAGRRPA
jgi:DNA polymerase III delta subunit